MTFIEMDCMKNVMTFLREKPQAKSALHCIIMPDLVINNTDAQTHIHNGALSLHMEKISPWKPTTSRQMECTTIEEQLNKELLMIIVRVHFQPANTSKS